MSHGGLESALRSIVSHLPLMPDSVIMVTGGGIRVREDANVIYCEPRAVERMTALPKNLRMVLSTWQRSHQVGDIIRKLAVKQHLEVPQYILTPGRLKEVLEFILKGIRPQEEISMSKPTPVVRTVVPKPALPIIVPMPEPKPLQMLTFDQACALFEDFFDRATVGRMSQTALIMEFAVLLEAGDYNMTDRDFRQLFAHYKALASWKPPHCDCGRRRDRMGNLSSLSPIRRSQW